MKSAFIWIMSAPAFMLSCSGAPQSPEVSAPESLQKSIPTPDPKRDSLTDQATSPEPTLPPYTFQAPGACGQQVANYVENAKQLGLNASFEVLEKGEVGCTYRFMLPLQDLQAGFNMMKKIFNLPKECAFPDTRKKTIADPTHPIASNKSRAAGYITQTIEMAEDNTGEANSIIWSDDDEVGYLKVSLRMDKNLAVFVVESGGH